MAAVGDSCDAFLIELAGQQVDPLSLAQDASFVVALDAQGLLCTRLRGAEPDGVEPPRLQGREDGLQFKARLAVDVEADIEINLW